MTGPRRSDKGRVRFHVLPKLLVAASHGSPHKRRRISVGIGSSAEILFCSPKSLFTVTRTNAVS